MNNGYQPRLTYTNATYDLVDATAEQAIADAAEMMKRKFERGASGVSVSIDKKHRRWTIKIGALEPPWKEEATTDN